MLKDCLFKYVRSFFDTGHVLKAFNRTNIVLIPKVQHPKTIKHLIHISLCNVIYKIISKLLVLRLEPYLSSIISPTQNVVVPGRMI